VVEILTPRHQQHRHRVVVEAFVLHGKERTTFITGFQQHQISFLAMPLGA
jgi:hypothetical protein